MSGMSHAGEFLKLAAEPLAGHRRAGPGIPLPDYSLARGSRCSTGVNIVFDGFLRGRMRR